MINEIISMNGYGIYVWSSFIFTFLSFGFLYIIIKTQLIREQLKFNEKFRTLNAEKKNTVRSQETYKGILEISSVSKI
jgi:heme exporter protein D|tara:strand:+ start:493 stop:726 length:234 start_codon:yes stop_codon:yes gene_type:complete